MVMGFPTWCRPPIRMRCSTIRNQGNSSWGERKQMSIQDTAPPAPFTNADVKSADLDFDKRIDVVRSTDNGYPLWFNLQAGKVLKGSANSRRHLGGISNKILLRRGAACRHEWRPAGGCVLDPADAGYLLRQHGAWQLCPVCGQSPSLIWCSPTAATPRYPGRS